MQLVKIPEERAKALLARIEDLEKAGDIKIESTAEEGIAISSEDPIVEWKAVDVVKAIGRGFEPDTAMRLFNEDYVLRIISLKEIFDTEKQRIRVKARVIGTKGKTRSTIEEVSGANMRVYGNTIAFIGKPEEVDLAERAVKMILNGSSHSSVYFFLQRERKRRDAAEHEL
jgi:ribosomal RNA assembly protein